MPYLDCPTCRLASFSAAAYSSRDECPRCGTELEPKQRPLFALPTAYAERAAAQAGASRPQVA